MAKDLTSYIESANRIQRRMAKSPCEYIEVAIAAERHAVETSGASSDDLRKAIRTLSSPEGWTGAQRDALVAWVEYLQEKIDRH